MKVEVDLERCQGYVCCVVAAPEVFDVDEESGLAVVTDPNPSEALRGKVEQAERDCPTNAVRVHP